ncbi:DNA cytosine methyltransferase [Oceanospirillum sp. HFRX-1_2]
MNAINAHFTTQYGLALDEFDDYINVDLFAGGGGASTGLEMGLDRPVHIAINHNPAAISMHEANHPGCLHLQTDVWDVDPVMVLAGRKIGWFHASPDCTHHSQAAGGQPRKTKIRNLSWVVLKWAGIGRPLVLSLENVKQIRQWGPLIAKRCKKTGRVLRLDGSVAEPGERVPRDQQFLVPDPKRRGKTWGKFLSSLRSLGYQVEHRLLKACDFGAPTSRERLFLIARRDGESIVWPEATHAAKPEKGQQKYRTAAECIDWTVPGKSIFDRKKPLADATMRRIAKGLKREVLDRQQPFIVPGIAASAHLVKFRFSSSGCAVDQPLPTITSGGNSKRPAGSPHAMGLVSAFVEQANGGFNTVPSRPVDGPLTTITNTGSQQRLVSAYLSRQFGQSVGQEVDSPAPTITASGQGKTSLAVVELSPEVEERALRCAAFLINYYGNGDARSLGAPADTLTTRDRLALVTVWISGDPYVVVDIHLRMLQPHELYAAQGFPSNYIIDRGHDGRVFTKSQQVHMCGNSVSPPPMCALARANSPYRVAAAVAA